MRAEGPREERVCRESPLKSSVMVSKPAVLTQRRLLGQVPAPGFSVREIGNECDEDRGYGAIKTFGLMFISLRYP